ncbi:hypothetical protein NF212_06295 [Parasalinivibrio latis]|uniref:hypothetical protein n=1 Tax=Parasalinivibrio latis TaxID=2952610 RepID=UPI0030E59C1F
MEGKQKSSGILGTIGALAGILAGLVAVIAAIFGAFIFIESRYVSNKDPEFVLFKEKYEEKLSKLIESNEITLNREIEKFHEKALKLQNEMTEKLHKSQATYASIQGQEQAAKEAVNNIKKYPGKVLSVSHIGGNGPNNELDDGLLQTKKLSFEKLRDDTILRINYVDNTRVTGNQKGCRWAVNLDGNNSCGNVMLYADRHDANHSNVHSNTSITGYCPNISAGEHEVTVHVSTVPGLAASNCYTGWDNSAWLIEVMEIIE